MTSLGFENYAEALKIYLARYREVSFCFPVFPTGTSTDVGPQTLVARGDHQRPSTGGGNPGATGSPSYEGGSHGGVLGGTMESGEGSGADFSYGATGGEY